MSLNGNPSQERTRSSAGNRAAKLRSAIRSIAYFLVRNAAYCQGSTFYDT